MNTISRRSRRGIAPIFVGLVAALLPACGLMPEKASTTSCSRDEQCLLAGKGSVCSQGVCETVVPPPDRPRMCSRSADCASKDGGAVQCIGGACVRVVDEESICNVVVGGPSDSEAILLGGFYTSRSVVPEGAAGGLTEVLMKQAVEQWNAKAAERGLPPAWALLCDERKDGAKAVQHLQQLGVSAIVGPVTPLSDVARASAAATKQTPYLTPHDGTVSGAPGAISCAPVRQDLAEGVAQGLGAIFSHVATKRARPIHVVVVSSTFQADSELHAELMSRLVTRIPPSSVASFAEERIEIDVSKPIPLRAKLLPRRNPAPDVVVLNADYAHGQLIDQVEMSWLAGPRPEYVLLGQKDAAWLLDTSQGGPFGEMALSGRTYAFDWDVGALGEAVRQDLLLRMYESDEGPLARPGMADFPFELDDCVRASLYASAAAVRIEGARPSEIRDDSFRAGLAFVSGRSGASTFVKTRDDSMQTVQETLASAVPLALVGATGRLSWRPDDKREVSGAIGLSCLKYGSWWKSTRSYPGAFAPGGEGDLGCTIP